MPPVSSSIASIPPGRSDCRSAEKTGCPSETRRTGSSCLSGQERRNFCCLRPHPARAAQVVASSVALILAELRLLPRCGQQWWWYTVAAGLFIGCLFAPLDSARSGIILVAALPWPALSLMLTTSGNAEVLFSTQAIIFLGSYMVFPGAGNSYLPRFCESRAGSTTLSGGLGLRLMLARDTEGLFGFSSLWPRFSFRPCTWHSESALKAANPSKLSIRPAVIGPTPPDAQIGLYRNFSPHRALPPCTSQLQSCCS